MLPNLARITATVTERRDLIGYTLNDDDTDEVMALTGPWPPFGTPRAFVDRLTASWLTVWQARYADALPAHDHARRGVRCRRCRTEHQARDEFLARWLNG